MPEERRVAANGLSFRYLDWGTKGQRPILFLHGGALTAHTWDLCCLALRDDYHCMALDQRGHGDSDWAPDADYSISAQREDVKGFTEAIGLDQFVLVGMSMGAINGLAYAIAYPETLSALVLIDAGPDVRRRGSSRIRDFVNGGAKPESLDAIIERALAFNPRRDPKVLRRSLMHNLRRQEDGNWVWKYDRRRFQEMGGERMPQSATGLPTGSQGSPARPWWCAAPRATSSTRRTASAWRSVCPTAASSRSPGPGTPSRATTQKIWLPRCTIFSAERVRQSAASGSWTFIRSKSTRRRITLNSLAGLATKWRDSWVVVDDSDAGAHAVISGIASSLRSSQ